MLPELHIAAHTVHHHYTLREQREQRATQCGTGDTRTHAHTASTVGHTLLVSLLMMRESVSVWSHWSGQLLSSLSLAVDTGLTDPLQITGLQLIMGPGTNEIILLSMVEKYFSALQASGIVYFTDNCQ